MLSTCLMLVNTLLFRGVTIIQPVADCDPHRTLSLRAAGPRPEPLAVEHRRDYERYLMSYPVDVSDLSFASLFIWRHAFHPAVVEVCNSMCVFCQCNGRLFALPPLGPAEALPDVVTWLAGYFRSLNRPFLMRAVPEDMAGHISTVLKDLEISTDRNYWDYVYRTSDLVDLPGRKYQGRRNHLNSFMRQYEFEYVPLNPSLTGECLALDEQWRQSRDVPETELTLEEPTAVREALLHMEELGIKGGAIRIEGRVRAFSAGAKVNPEMAVIHIEKADAEFRGLYELINQQAARNTWGETRFINREDDMGLPGLRRAKEAYQPEYMVKKYDLLGRV